MGEIAELTHHEIGDGIVARDHDESALIRKDIGNLLLAQLRSIGDYLVAVAGGDYVVLAEYIVIVIGELVERSYGGDGAGEVLVLLLFGEYLRIHAADSRDRRDLIDGGLRVGIDFEVGIYIVCDVVAVVVLHDVVQLPRQTRNVA